MESVRNLRRNINFYGTPIVKVEDPFAHFHPRSKREAARIIYKDFKDQGLTPAEMKQVVLGNSAKKERTNV